MFDIVKIDGKLMKTHGSLFGGNVDFYFLRGDIVKINDSRCKSVPACKRQRGFFIFTIISIMKKQRQYMVIFIKKFNFQNPFFVYMLQFVNL